MQQTNKQTNKTATAAVSTTSNKIAKGYKLGSHSL
jgi:hypothetical protein